MRAFLWDEDAITGKNLPPFPGHGNCSGAFKDIIPFLKTVLVQVGLRIHIRKRNAEIFHF